MIIRKSVLALVVFALCSVASAQDVRYIYIKDLPSTTEKYLDDFKEVSDTVNKNYTHLKGKNIDGFALQSKYIQFAS